MITAIFYIIFFVVTRSYAISKESKVNYYENLIKENVQSASTYKLPENAAQYKPANSSIKSIGKYDFIIVGAGSSGTVIANRLSEIKNWNILILEAGTYGNQFIDIPAMQFVTHQSKYNWGFKSTPQKNACLAMKNETCPCPRGRGVGGTTLINGLVYSRGSKLDFDKWAQLGNNGWSYKEVLPYFKKSEAFHPSSSAPFDQDYHGQNNNLNVEYHYPSSTEGKAFLKAFSTLGYDLVDYNGRKNNGVSPAQTNTKRGRREDGYHAFIEPARNRSNLFVATNSYVTNILISNESKTAVGVQFVHYGQIYKVYAKYETIISAGSILTPHILMNSGVGPSEHLNKLKVPLVNDLPVGETLREHASYSMTISYNASAEYLPMSSFIKEYFKGYGYLALGGPTECVAYVQTSTESVPMYPNLEIILSPNTGNSTPGVPLEEFDYKEDLLTASTSSNLQSFTIALVALHTKSTGVVKLKSNSPYDYPMIDFNLLSDQNDLKTLVEGVQFVKKLLDTPAFKKINASIIDTPIKPCQAYKNSSEEYTACLIRYYSISGFHPVGTCPMGAVVDDELKVFGIRNLRIADASVFPTVTSGHPNAVCVMIGEKLSDMLKTDYFKYS